jgi:gamma-glutamylcyclotransferase (GGCT)/AIG2-like uncharacterized protein YtfP
MRPAFLPDFELTGADAALVLTPRIGSVVEGELFDSAANGRDVPDRRDLFSCTLILPGGSCVAAAACTIQERSPASRPEAAEPAPSRIFRAAAVAAQPSAVVPGIFVYGTLMRGEELDQVLSGHGLAEMQPATVRGHLRHLGDYPGLLLEDQGGVVHGEFAVAADLSAVLSELDEIECTRPQGQPGGLYRRTMVIARLRDGREERAWVYVIDDPGTHPIIRSGNWRDRSL